MSGRYTPIQNEEALSFADTVVGSGQAYYESGGELKGGAKVFVNMILPGHLYVPGNSNDKVEKRMLLATSHNGTVPLVMKWVSLRVICQNTFNAALREKSDEFKIRHTPDFKTKVIECQKALKLASAYFDDLQGVINILAESKFTKDKMAGLAASLFPADGDKVPTRTVNIREEITTLFDRGTGNGGETKWDALNAVTEYIDHKRTFKGEGEAGESNRVDTVLFGSGARIKGQALELLLN